VTIAELIAELDRFDPEQEVRWAAQPSWPLEYGIRGLVESEPEEDEPGVVYLVEGVQHGYLPGVVAEEAWA